MNEPSRRCLRLRVVQRCALKFCPVAEMEDLKNEIGMQCLSKHPNIVTVREAFVTKTEVRSPWYMGFPRVEMSELTEGTTCADALAYHCCSRILPMLFL